MTINQFRESSPYVLRMREILSDETMQIALLALKDSNVAVRTTDDAEAIVSVRRYERAAGFNDCLVQLLSLADMIAPPVPEEQTTYGVPDATLT